MLESSLEFLRCVKCGAKLELDTRTRLRTSLRTRLSTRLRTRLSARF